MKKKRDRHANSNINKSIFGFPALEERSGVIWAKVVDRQTDKPTDIVLPRAILLAWLLCKEKVISLFYVEKEQ